MLNVVPMTEVFVYQKKTPTVLLRFRLEAPESEEHLPPRQ